MSPIKVTVPGRTSMERLTNLTKRVIAVPKEEVEREEQKWRKERQKRKLSLFTAAMGRRRY